MWKIGTSAYWARMKWESKHTNNRSVSVDLTMERSDMVVDDLLSFASPWEVYIYADIKRLETGGWLNAAFWSSFAKETISRNSWFARCLLCQDTHLEIYCLKSQLRPWSLATKRGGGQLPPLPPHAPPPSPKSATEETYRIKLRMDFRIECQSMYLNIQSLIRSVIVPACVAFYIMI